MKNWKERGHAEDHYTGGSKLVDEAAAQVEKHCKIAKLPPNHNFVSHEVGHVVEYEVGHGISHVVSHEIHHGVGHRVSHGVGHCIGHGVGHAVNHIMRLVWGWSWGRSPSVSRCRSLCVRGAKRGSYQCSRNLNVCDHILILLMILVLKMTKKYQIT